MKNKVKVLVQSIKIYTNTEIKNYTFIYGTKIFGFAQYTYLTFVGLSTASLIISIQPL